MEYKRQEIQEYFDDYIKENKEWWEEHYPNHWLDELHHNAFNQDYYIIYTEEAKRWLGDQVFEVIRYVKDYEEINFGELQTDLSEPCNIVNMYVYIIGEEIVADYINELEEVA